MERPDGGGRTTLTLAEPVLLRPDDEREVRLWHSRDVGRGYGAICASCGTKCDVHDGPGMIAMPFRCGQCGKEWWWHFGPELPIGKEPNPPACECGGTFISEAPPRCPACRSTDFVRDPDAEQSIYD